VTLLAASALGYAFPDGRQAVTDCSLAVETPTSVALLGANGAGKSTLLELLGGLRDPDDGEVSYFGTDRSADDLRDRLAVVTQHPAEYLFNDTVAADLRYGPAQMGLDASAVDRRVERVADRLALTHLLDRSPDRLSGGQMRRAALASALTVDPDLLLVDEPFADLDATHRKRVRSVLDESVAEGTAVVYATPDVERAATADRVVLLGRDESVAADGPPEAVLIDGELLRTHGLEPPQVVALCRKLGLEDPPVTTEGAVSRFEKLL
jgi:cobalt/nickel transport system ATP-binding protein